MLDPSVGAGTTVARFKDRDSLCRSMHLQRVSEGQSIRDKRGATGGKEAVPAEVLLGNERQWFGAALCNASRLGCGYSRVERMVTLIIGTRWQGAATNQEVESRMPSMALRLTFPALSLSIMIDR